jgi:hypothetical protein
VITSFFFFPCKFGPPDSKWLSGCFQLENPVVVGLLDLCSQNVFKVPRTPQLKCFFSLKVQISLKSSFYFNFIILGSTEAKMVWTANEVILNSPGYSDNQPNRLSQEY